MLDKRTYQLTLSEVEQAWVFGRFTKVCVQIEGEEQLRAVHEAGRRLGIPCELIIDSGRTEFGGVPTPTCCAVGPALVEAVDRVTGHLKLY